MAATLIAWLLFGAVLTITAYASNGVDPAVSTVHFVRAAFANNPPPPQAVFLGAGLRTRVERALQHRTSLLRARYWRSGARTVWILDEIGKEQPITTGVQIDAGAITRLQVLQYRESRGGEVRRADFLAQFRSVRLQADDQLDRRIDGITGATLSVRALTRQARMALVLHDHLNTTAALMSARPAHTSTPPQ